MVGKRAIRESILCVTHQMSRKRRNYSVGWTVPHEIMNYEVAPDGTGSVYDDTGWYLISLSWHILVLGGTGSAKGLYACIYWKKWRFGRVLPIPNRQTDWQQNIELLNLSTVWSLIWVTQFPFLWPPPLPVPLLIYACPASLTPICLPSISIPRRITWCQGIYAKVQIYYKSPWMKENILHLTYDP